MPDRMGLTLGEGDPVVFRKGDRWSGATILRVRARSRYLIQLDGARRTHPAERGAAGGRFRALELWALGAGHDGQDPIEVDGSYLTSVAARGRDEDEDE